MLGKLAVSAGMVLLLLAGPAAAQTLPRPTLQFQKVEQYQAGGKDWVRYKFEVMNRGDYPPAQFAAAPALPPCGKNTRASRTWVDFYTKDGQRLYGFCALATPVDLDKLWFAVEAGTEPPRWVYIELTDRQTNQKVRSNLAIVP